LLGLFALFGFVQAHDEFVADRMRLQDDVEAFRIVVKECGSDVEPVVILLGARYDRVDPIHLVVFWARCIFLSATGCHLLSGPREHSGEHEQAAAREYSCGRGLVSDVGSTAKSVAMWS